MKDEQVAELLYQALEPRRGHSDLRDALRCTVNASSRKNGRNTCSRPVSTRQLSWRSWTGWASTPRRSYERVEDQEDEHLYHTTGWGRELWIESLGMPAVLPPPEEEKEVKTAIGVLLLRKSAVA